MSYKENMQSLWVQYADENGEEPSSIADCFQWAMKKGLWHPKPVDVAKIFQREMADALRQKMRTDASGRTYRAMQCVRESKGGVQLVLWGDIDTVSRDFMEKAVQHRRKGLVDDGYKLKQDVDHFNEYRSPEEPIQLVLDVTEDVAEREAWDGKDDDERDAG